MSGSIAEQGRLLRASPRSQRSVQQGTARVARRAGTSPETGSIGNQALQRALTAGNLQAKLVVNEPGDQYEQEADRMADRVMRMASPGVFAAAPASEAGIQRKCAACEEEEPVMRAPASIGVIQRKCAACEEEDRVMRAAAPAGMLQRACAACEEDEQPVMRVTSGILQRDEAEPPPEELDPDAAEAAEEEEEKDNCAQAKRSPGVPEVTPSIEAGIDSLRGGGAPLPPSTRDFFEQRLGYDFGSVRVHAGPRADVSARAVGALAYTVGQDVVFGNGQYSPHTDAGRRLLAHELTHVVQQTPVAARKIARTAASRHHADAAGALPLSNPSPSAMLQRQAYYWGPNRRIGTAEHNQILKALGKRNSIFTEAPVGASTRFNIGTGAVDLYDASTTVGVYFKGHNDPQPLAPLPGHALRRNGESYGPSKHAQNAAPYYADGKVIRTGAAPSTINIGELKPPPDSEAAHKGRGQLESYKGAFSDTAAHLNDLAREQPSAVPDCTIGSQRAARCWQPDVDLMKSLAVPTEYSETGATVSENLVLKSAFDVTALIAGRRRGVKPHQPIFTAAELPPVPGRLIVGDTPAPGSDGIFNYAYLPENATLTVQPRGQFERLEADVAGLVEPLTAEIRARAPGSLSRKIDPSASIRRRTDTPAPEVSTTPRSVQRRRASRVSQKVEGHDPFKEQYETWKTTRKALKKEYKDALKQRGDVSKAQAAEFMLEAYEDAKKTLGLRTDRFKPAPKVLPIAKASRKLRFWLGVPGAWVGAARYYLGKGVVRLVSLIESMKAGVRRLLTPDTSSSGLGGGAVAAAKKAFVRVAKLAASYLIERTFDDLVTSLMQGVKSRVTALLEETGNLEAFKENFKKVREIQCQLEEKLAGWFDAVRTQFEGYLKVFETLERVAGKITRIINIVKWGIRIASCLSPPGVGCLWLLVQAATEYVLAKMIESCWFQDELLPVVLEIADAIKPIREAPRNLANWIIEGINSNLPVQFQGIFATLPEVDSNPSPSDLPCGEEMSNEDRERKLAIQNLIDELGEEKYDALVALTQVWGIKGNAVPTAEQIRALMYEMRKYDHVTAKDIKEFMKTFPLGPEGRPDKMVGIGEFLDGLKEAIDPQTGHLAASGAGVGDGTGGGGTTEGEGGGGAAGNEAKPTITEDLKAKLQPKRFYPSVTGLGTGVYAGADVFLTFTMKVKGLTYSFPGIPHRVMTRMFRPNTQRPQTIDFKIKLTKDAFFTLTNPKGDVIDALAFYASNETPIVSVPYPDGVGKFVKPGPTKKKGT